MQEYQRQQLNQFYKPKFERDVSYSLQSLYSAKHYLGILSSTKCARCMAVYLNTVAFQMKNYPPF